MVSLAFFDKRADVAPALRTVRESFSFVEIIAAPSVWRMFANSTAERLRPGVAIRILPMASGVDEIPARSEHESETPSTFNRYGQIRFADAFSMTSWIAATSIP